MTKNEIIKIAEQKYFRRYSGHVDEQIALDRARKLEINAFVDGYLEALSQHDVINWVSVLDNLPPIEESVLVYDGFRIYISNRLDENGIVWDESQQILDKVTHWMHLPQIPCE
jgi:hypothetical protein